MSFDDKWTVAEGVANEFPLIIRYRSINNPAFFFARFPHLISISWDFCIRTDSGLPSQVESIDLDFFENLLVENIECNNVAVLVVVITNDNCRDFYLHTDNLQVFVDQFHKMPQKQEPYPVQIEVTSDECGEFCRGIFENCS